MCTSRVRLFEYSKVSRRLHAILLLLLMMMMVMQNELSVT